MFEIKDVKAREVLDSRGLPTVEADVFVESFGKRCMGRSSIPSGSSRGRKEAFELRDRDSARFRGLGVLKAVRNVQFEIRNSVVGKCFESLSSFDSFLRKLDGTPDKSRLGANAMLSVSMGCHVALAKCRGCSLYRLFGEGMYGMPMPFVNILNGGKHADNALDVQEFMIVPLSFSSFSNVVEKICAVFFSLKKILLNRGFSVAVGDEGGVSPQLSCSEEALDLLMLAIEDSGMEPGTDFGLALDVAASELYDDKLGCYLLDSGTRSLDSSGLIRLYENWIKSYPIVSLEDGMAEDDWSGWANLTAAMGSRVQLVGDDVFVTSAQLLRKAADHEVGNCILLKPNQVGTVSEVIEAWTLACSLGYHGMLSHRSGETEDTFIVDLAVGLNVGQIKIGSVCRGERIAKYNQLLRIENELLGNY